MSEECKNFSIERRHRPSLVDVAFWEARRCWSNSFNRWLLAVTSGLFLLLTWLLQHPASVELHGFLSFAVSGGSAWGAASQLYPFSFLLALILPVLNSSGIAHDLRSRTYELLMTTPVSTKTYVLGRYLFYVCGSCGLSLLLLVAALLMHLFLHIVEGSYLTPQFLVFVGLWGVAILPMTIFLSSLSFVLGTLQLRYAHFFAIGIIVLWFCMPSVLTYLPDAGAEGTPGYKLWDPTNFEMSRRLVAPYNSALSRMVRMVHIEQPADAEARQLVQRLQTLEQTAPDLRPWILPHLVWVAVGLILLVYVLCSFKRFRNVMT